MNAVAESFVFQDDYYANTNHKGFSALDVFSSNSMSRSNLSADWVEQLKHSLVELTKLPAGWDGYDGEAVSLQTARFVEKVLDVLYQEDIPAPSLVPGSDGSLQIEWHMNMYDLELDVLGVQNIEASRLDLMTGKEQVVEIQSDFSKIVDWIVDLSVPREH